MEIKKTPSSFRIKFTLIELLVVIAVISILASLLLPALSSARERTKGILCASNQKQIACAMLNYTDDYSGYLPPLWGTQYWWDEITPYVGSPATRSPLLFCPSESYEGGSRGPVMGMNANLKDTSTSTATIYNGCKLVRVTTPSRTLLVADAFYWPSWGNSSSIINTVLEEKIGVKYRHLRSANVAFSDGHVEGEKLYMPTEILDL